jgi:hypothetical protein
MGQTDSVELADLQSDRLEESLELATEPKTEISGGRHRVPDWSDKPEAGELRPSQKQSSPAGSYDGVEDRDAHQDEQSAASPGLLTPYSAFDEPLPEVGDTPLAAMVTNVVRIVECEGPILGHRLHQVYVKASGGRRVGREIARQLNQAITLAERRGLIVSENPLGEGGVKPKTFRTPAQPSVCPRELGPRTLDAVPPAELAHHLSDLASADLSLSDESLFRAVLDLLGLKRLTENTRVVLSSAMALADLTGPQG